MAIMSARYTVIDGEVVAQERSGVRHQLVPDPLGSTVALYDNSETKTDTFSYWPYGESATRTGVTVAKFQYVGSFGYYHDGEYRNYVRARYLRKVFSVWISQDDVVFLNKNPNLYLYCERNPIVYTDSTGNYPDQFINGIINSAKNSFCMNNYKLYIPKERERINKCIQENKKTYCPYLFHDEFRCFAGWCKYGSVKLSEGSKCDHACAYAPIGEGWGCTVTICKCNLGTSGCWDDGTLENMSPVERMEWILIHEIGHCCGIEHGVPNNSKRPRESCNDVISCCIRRVLEGSDTRNCRRRISR